MAHEATPCHSISHRALWFLCRLVWFLRHLLDQTRSHPGSLCEWSQKAFKCPPASHVADAVQPENGLRRHLNAFWGHLHCTTMAVQLISRLRRQLNAFWSQLSCAEVKCLLNLFMLQKHWSAVWAHFCFSLHHGHHKQWTGSYDQGPKLW